MRGFIDRIGARNLLCLRHLCIPFPLLDSESGGGGGMGGGQRQQQRRYLMDMDLDGSALCNVLPGGLGGALSSLWRRCPNLELIEFDLSWSGPGHSLWKGDVRHHDRQMLMESLNAALRQEFKRLREIVVNIHYGPSFRGEGSSDGAACEALVEEMRGRYGWTVKLPDCDGGERDELDQYRSSMTMMLRIPYWHRPSPTQGFRWTAHAGPGGSGGWEAYGYGGARIIGTSGTGYDEEDDEEYEKPTKPPRGKRQFAKDVGRKIVDSRAFSWGLVVVFSPTIPVLMAIDGINKKRRKRKNEKLSPGSSTASIPRHASLPEPWRAGS